MDSSEERHVPAPVEENYPNTAVAEAESRGSARICSQNESWISLHSRKEPSTTPSALSSPFWGSALVFERLLTLNSNFKVRSAYMLLVWVANSSSNKWRIEDVSRILIFCIWKRFNITDTEKRLILHYGIDTDAWKQSNIWSELKKSQKDVWGKLVAT